MVLGRRLGLELDKNDGVKSLAFQRCWSDANNFKSRIPLGSFWIYLAPFFIFLFYLILFSSEDNIRNSNGRNRKNRNREAKGTS